MFAKGIGIAVLGSIIMLAAYVIWGVSNPEAFHPSVDMSDVPAEQRGEVEYAAQRLFVACPGLVTYSREIESLTARTDNFIGKVAFPRDYGWNRWITFDIQLKRDSNTPPEWAVYGERITYSVGQTGIAITKPKAGNFCGLGHKAGLVALQ